MQTIALQLRGNESLSAVSKLLNDLRTDLEVRSTQKRTPQAKQIDADTEKTQIVTQCKKDLENYAQRISLSVNEIKDSEFKAKRLNEAVSVYSSEIEEKQRQIKVEQRVSLILIVFRSSRRRTTHYGPCVCRTRWTTRRAPSR